MDQQLARLKSLDELPFQYRKSIDRIVRKFVRTSVIKKQTNFISLYVQKIESTIDRGRGIMEFIFSSFPMTAEDQEFIMSSGINLVQSPLLPNFFFNNIEERNCFITDFIPFHVHSVQGEEFVRGPNGIQVDQLHLEACINDVFDSFKKNRIKQLVEENLNKYSKVEKSALDALVTEFKEREKLRKKYLKKKQKKLEKRAASLSKEDTEPSFEAIGGGGLSQLSLSLERNTAELSSKTSSPIKSKLKPEGGWSKKDQKLHETKQQTSLVSGGGGGAANQSLARRNVRSQGLNLTEDAQTHFDALRQRSFRNISIREGFEFLRKCGYYWEGTTQHAKFVDRSLHPPHIVNMPFHGDSIPIGTMRGIFESMGLI